MKISNEKMVKIVKFTAIGLIVLILFFGSFYTISDQEQAVVVTFGVPEAVSEPGLHLKLPLIQKVQKVDTTIKGFAIGYYEEHNLTNSDESVMITSDFNFVNVDFYVEYRVIDPVKMLYASEDPVNILKMVTQSCIRNVVGTTDVDSVITTGKSEIQSAIKENVIETLEKEEIGIQLVNITIQDSEPPTAEVMEAFTAVEAAKQGKETAINNAKKYSNEQLPAAEAQADQIIKAAEAEKAARVNEANGQVARFEALYNEYKNYPLITKKRMYFEAMRNVLPGLKVIISSDESMSKHYVIEEGVK
ncbi:MAG: FtsH protease activity modulator HflK [Lachnospiraceae bacterium]|nr:FtsH protease activity modulator HflK [Lachnospiraceae bacterium]